MPAEKIVSVRLKAITDQFKAGMTEASAATRDFGQKVGGHMTSAGASMQRVGVTMTKTVTPAALSLGAISAKAFADFDAGADGIRASTGATGKALDGLTDSMKRVGGSVTQNLGQVGQVIGELNKRTGQTGPNLEKLAAQILDLDRLGNQASVENVTRLFGDWSIATDRQSKTLDELFKVSQATGPTVDRLGELLVKYGAPLRQLGFGFRDSALLLGKFEKEGVNTELVMGSLRISLGKMAKSGEDARSTFTRVVGEIKNAGSVSEANAKALELFGARAGPDMAAAIREGKFEIGDLAAKVSASHDTIVGAAKDTEDWSDKFAMLKNRAEAVIGPVGEYGMAIAGIAAGAGPAIAGIGSVIKWVGKLGSTTSEAGDAVSGGLLSSLGGLTPVLAGVGGALIVGTALYAQYSNAKAQAKKRTEEFISTLNDEDGALTQNTRQLILNTLEHRNQTDDLKRSGISYKEWISAVEASGSKLMSEGEYLAFAELGRKKLAAQLRAEGGARNELIAKSVEEDGINKGLLETLKEQSSAYDEGQKKLKDRKAIGAEVAKTETDVADASNKAADATSKHAEAAQKSADEIKAEDDALNDLIDTLMASADSQFAYDRSVRSAQDALAKFVYLSGAAKAQGGKNADTNRDLADATDDAKEALLREASAFADMQEKQLEANGGSVTAADKQAILVGALKDVAKELDPKSPLRRYLDEYIYRLGAIPSEVTTTVATRYEESGRPIDQGVTTPTGRIDVRSIQQTLASEGFLSPNQVDGVWGPVTQQAYNKYLYTHGGVPGRASGGFVPAGTMFTAAENGSELLMATAGGVQVLSAPGTQQAMLPGSSGQASGLTVENHQHFTLPPDHDVPRQAGRELQKLSIKLAGV